VKIQREEVVRAVAEANAEAAAAGDDAEAQLRAALGARGGAAADGSTPSEPTDS
jgi:carbon storage regulator